MECARGRSPAQDCHRLARLGDSRDLHDLACVFVNAKKQSAGADMAGKSPSAVDISSTRSARPSLAVSSASTDAMGEHCGRITLERRAWARRKEKGRHLQSFASELDLVALDVFDEEYLQLGQVVQGEVAHGIAQDAFLREGGKLRRELWGVRGTKGGERLYLEEDNVRS
jgi:hypothetical protein